MPCLPDNVPIDLFDDAMTDDQDRTKGRSDAIYKAGLVSRHDQFPAGLDGHYGSKQSRQIGLVDSRSRAGEIREQFLELIFCKQSGSDPSTGKTEALHSIFVFFDLFQVLVVKECQPLELFCAVDSMGPNGVKEFRQLKKAVLAECSNCVCLLRAGSLHNLGVELGSHPAQRFHEGQVSGNFL
jgi:hypothetical protein